MKKLFLVSLLAVLTSLSVMAVDVNSVAGLKDAVATPNAEILLTKKITWKVSDGDLDLNGATIDCNGASKFGITFSGTGELTWSNGTFTNNTTSTYALTCPASGLTLNLNNITIDNTVKYGVSVKANTLNVDEDCEFISSSRAIVVASGSVINNYGKISRIYGANTADGVTIDNHGTITWNTAFSAVNVEITNNAGASITISSTAAGSYEISNAGTLAFTGGTQAGTFTITNDGTFTMASSGKRTGTFNVTNHGTYTISKGTQSGTFNIENDGTFAMTGGTHSGAFEIKNDGTFTISGGTLSSESFAVVNNESFTVTKCTQTGSLSIENKGTLAITGGKSKSAINGSCEINNDGTLSLTGSTSTYPFAGTFDITNSQPLTLTNQYFSNEVSFTNSGELNLRGGKYTGAASITNSGEVHLYTYVSGKTKYVPTFGSTLDITNDGTFTIDNISAKEGVVSFNGSQNTTISAGTFAAAPDGSKGYIAPSGEADCYFAEGVGSLSVAAGYAWRSFDKLVTETTAAVKIFHANGTTETAILEQAVAEAEDKDSIVLLGDVKTFAPLFIGTENVDGTPISLIINLNGKTLTSAPALRFTFVLTHGALRVVNSVSGKGGIYNTYPAVGETGGEVFRLHGSYLKNCNPRTQTPFVHLFVDKDVDIHADEDMGSGITISEMYGSSPFVKDHLNYLTNVYAGAAGSQPGVANGVRVDIKGSIYSQKYGVKINGQVRFPHVDEYGVGTSAETYRESVDYMKGYVVAIGDTAYSPYVHIAPSAHIESAADKSSAVGVYSAGYGRWFIEGTLLGATGLYAKSGDINLNDATIQSTYTGTAFTNTGKGSGVDAYGSAVVIETNASYSGEQALAVNGDTQVSTEAEGGAALLDVVEGKVDESAVEAITINGGSFSGDNAIVISEKTAESGEADVTVSGGVSFVGETKVADETGTEALNTIVDPETTHTTTIDNGDGKQVVVISSGPKPGEYTWAEILLLADNANASWIEKGISKAQVIGDGESAVSRKFGEFTMGAGTGPEDANIQQLTIKNHATLEVQRLILNANARIIVEAGGKLVVKGEEGVETFSTDNILLKTSESAQAIFLIHPNVDKKRHPQAKVELTSKGYKDGSKDIWQRFGVPSYNESIERVGESFIYSVPPAVYKYDYSKDDWTLMAKTDKFVPFMCYEMTNASPAPGAKYTFACKLVGNDSRELDVVAPWNYYSNSYTAPVDLASLRLSFKESGSAVDATIYLYRAKDNWWYEINDAAVFFGEDENGDPLPSVIDPLQAFILRRVAEDVENPVINYKDNVYDPIMTPKSPAPARSRQLINNATITLTSADGTRDFVRLLEDAQFSGEFDNGWDAAKYMHDNSVNMYANVDGNKLDYIASDNLEGLTFSLDTKEQTSFTMTIGKVNGLEYAVRDRLTGTEIIMAEGATYMFSVPANTEIADRFEIVRIHNVSTAIDAINTNTGSKRIYSVTGQYVGEDYHSLPAGVYVIDGKKIVK